MAVISKLLPVLISAFSFQSLCAAIFVPRQDERYFDLAGALGYLSSTFISLYYPALKTKYLYGNQFPLPPLSSFASRQLLLSAALGIWSVRLGSFLVARTLKAGGDSRFDKYKYDPAKFTALWLTQATWVFLVGLPVFMANTLPSHLHAPLGPRDYAAFGLFAGSFLFEVIADLQKSAWRKAKDNKEHDEKFITRGLWSISRHPNYVGEVGIWTGIWALSIGSLRSTYFPRLTWLLTLVSPLTTYLLVRYATGAAPLEKTGQKKFGNDPKWQEYTKNVPVFWPFGPRS